ncbi:hypothetical protein [uncultured Roseivirga sp.]|uniref:hypothetical protein n=1 Tax=uncultured Roseivirga sp. TaxID=543088 RepID=UPI000D7A1535|nr:hypothetical protein [uncultured Roseivirga sp.]PWL29828.1 MAG: hypothetical protein DCO95_08275 [Roseivirga sp. XM-24bin3]
MKKLFIATLLGFLLFDLQAQNTFIPYNRDYYHLIDRFQIMYTSKDNLLQTTLKPIRRASLSNFLLNIEGEYEGMSELDKFNYEFLMNDNWYNTKSKFNDNPKSWWDLMYERKSDFYVYKTDDFVLRINPALTFSGGKGSDEDQVLYTNTRGAEIQGEIDGKIGFYSMLSTTQARFPMYVHDFIRTNQAFPNEGFWKDGEGNSRTWDFFHARGYITFNLTKSINVQTGYDKHFMGNGMRSLMLSDFSSPMLFGKITTQLGPFRLTNLFAELTEDIEFAGQNPGDGKYPKKFLASHRIDVSILPNLELGLFEAIVADSANINYFNPVIFYRSIEQQQGSPDNTLIGMDFKLNLKKQYQIYGQFIFDEFVISELRSGGSWRNKFGVQLGGKYLNAFNISNLDLQAEFNVARPYLYAYERPALSFSNYRNPLAHPMGANLKEIALVGRYQPIPKLFVTGKLIRTQYGEDENGINYGGNVLSDTDDRVRNGDFEIGQGVATTNTYLELTGSYMLLHNVFLDWKNIYRKKDSEIDARSTSSFMTMLSLRWNLPQREHEF